MPLGVPVRTSTQTIFGVQFSLALHMEASNGKLTDATKTTFEIGGAPFIRLALALYSSVWCRNFIFLTIIYVSSLLTNPPVPCFLRLSTNNLCLLPRYLPRQ